MPISIPSLISQSASTNLLTQTRQERRQLLRLFWIVAISLFIYEFFWAETNSLIATFGTLLITTAALLPSYLWCSGRALGMPIFPIFALPFIWTHALPLISKHPKVISYNFSSHLIASLTTVGFLSLGTLIWFQFVKFPPPIPGTYRVLDSSRGDKFFLVVLTCAILFNVASTGGWLLLTGGSFALLRGGILGLAALATFTLAYRAGSCELSKRHISLFWFLLITYMITNAVGLLLVGAATTFMVATVAFTIGRKKPPVLLIAITLVMLTLLHMGKGEMRSKYWFSGPGVIVQPWQYPAWYSEWIDYSLTGFGAGANPELAAPSSQQSLLERSSLIHLLLLAQDRSPETVPYLNGQTYAIIPQLLVPRILNPNKLRSHEGTYLLNIHYGRQRREDTYSTTIGWGLMNEAYANFGQLGCMGLAIILGITYGQATRWSIHAPLLSAQSLFAVLMITFAFQTEWSASVFVTALFQSSISLLGVVVVLMRTTPTKSVPMFLTASDMK